MPSSAIPFFMVFATFLAIVRRTIFSYQIGVRMGDWKMVVKKGKPFLYNLATDIHEDHDIAAE